MIRLQYSEHLQRKIRQDDPQDLSIPTWTLLREAIIAGRTDEALEFLADGKVGAKTMHDLKRGESALLLTYIADNFGEEQIEKYWRHQVHTSNWLAQGYSVEDEVQIDAEQQRQHQGNLTIVEERDRYVITCDPCGSGGKARRDKIGGVTKKAYPWSWSKRGVPYYCLHCALNWEIAPIEIRGYPIRVNLIGDTPEDPCVHLFYKKPELIPEEYFTRVGKTKTIK
jgi:hypothetical protein